MSDISYLSLRYNIPIYLKPDKQTTAVLDNAQANIKIKKEESESPYNLDLLDLLGKEWYEEYKFIINSEKVNSIKEILEYEKLLDSSDNLNSIKRYEKLLKISFNNFFRK